METLSKTESFDLGQFIPLHYHHVMLLDDARTGAFKEAIDILVKPGSKVVELGGGTGILSYFAACHASKVWYVEKNPELYRFAKNTLAANAHFEKIELINEDGAIFVPPEPVDTVICEMLHVGMLREKQLQVLTAFKHHYLKKFGLPLPRFIPEAAFLGVQLCENSFDYNGYHCPIMTFQDPSAHNKSTTSLSDAVPYLLIEYQKPFPLTLSWRGALSCRKEGILNSLRFTLKNIVGIVEKEDRAISWFSSNLILPLDAPFRVHNGMNIQVSFEYEAGGTIESLANSLTVSPEK